ncbi:hypothetical protein [Salinarchaeum sp. Harcht-Bsk1]|uniref:hypothetical protein n=1 Tax=Salinarchaeum sp. Harcht-Bsk1 TaxID=1333523 RepID=UPI001651467D|nr:hypothetical protein [Salinarchaeum sp. Harcht-Bsk1]
MMDNYTDTADLVGMLGGALVAIGVVVLGALNTLTQNPHMEQTNDAGAVTAEPLVPADIRAYIILIGLALLLLYGLYKVATPLEPTTVQRTAPADD